MTLPSRPCRSLSGQGTFGQVLKCQVDGAEAAVALKITKNRPAYFNQDGFEATGDESRHMKMTDSKEQWQQWR